MKYWKFKTILYRAFNMNTLIAKANKNFKLSTKAIDTYV